MYFWKTDELARAIKEDKVSELEWKNYYLAASVFLLISIYLGALAPRTGGIPLLLLEAALIIAITVVGINITFKTNQLGTGGNYIARVTALGFPILIKIFLLGLLGGIISGILAGTQVFAESSPQILISLISVLAQLFFFWRINHHLKFINTLDGSSVTA
jgi:hypothetical protein